MKLSEKIAEIRRQPEHIRLRYVWGSVAISMFFIITIWIFSITLMFTENNGKNKVSEDSATALTEQLKTVNNQLPSIENFSEKTGSSIQNSNTADTIRTDNLQQ